MIYIPNVGPKPCPNRLLNPIRREYKGDVVGFGPLLGATLVEGPNWSLFQLEVPSENP